jgi:hypothetical protein
MGLFKDFQSIVMWMFWAFKLSFDLDILVFRPIFPKIWRNFIQFSGHTEPRLFFSKDRRRVWHRNVCKLAQMARAVFTLTQFLTKTAYILFHIYP